MRRLLFEIGTEELPAGVIRAAVDELWTKVTKGLQAAGLAHGNEERVATPRRLAVLADVASSTEEKTELVLGPPVRVAFDGSGAPTKATLAFASRVGREPAELERVTTDKGEYVATRVRVAARSAADCLLPVLRDALNLYLSHQDDIPGTRAAITRKLEGRLDAVEEQLQRQNDLLEKMVAFFKRKREA